MERKRKPLSHIPGNMERKQKSRSRAPANMQRNRNPLLVPPPICICGTLGKSSENNPPAVWYCRGGFPMAAIFAPHFWARGKLIPGQCKLYPGHVKFIPPIYPLFTVLYSQYTRYIVPIYKLYGTVHLSLCCRKQFSVVDYGHVLKFALHFYPIVMNL